MKMEFALDKSVEIRTTLMTPMSHGAHQGADFLLKHAGKANKHNTCLPSNSEIPKQTQVRTKDSYGQPTGRDFHTGEQSLNDL